METYALPTTIDGGAYIFSEFDALKVALEVTIKPGSQRKSKKKLIHLSVKMEYLLVSMAIS